MSLDEVTVEQLRSWLLRYADQIDQQQAYLTELDAAIGDADHGINMQHGMEKLRQRLNDSAHESVDISSFLRSVAMTLISNIGGAAGPLYGAFFLRAALDVSADGALDLADLARLFRNGLNGIQQRGKAQADDKTMVDALLPAVEALEVAATAGSTIADAFAAARCAAAAGMEHTIGLEAQKGRASYLGPRSIGHQDPGATSAFYLVAAAAETLGV